MICISTAADEISGMWIREDNKNDQATVRSVSVSGDIHSVTVERGVETCLCERERLSQRGRDVREGAQYPTCDLNILL